MATLTSLIVPTEGTSAKLVGRTVHPWAWWGWALSVAAAASLVTNPWVTLLLAAAVITTMWSRRGDGPWGQALKIYLFIAAIIVALRLIVAIFFGGTQSGTILFTLPQIPLPDWAAGIRIGGPVVLENLLYSVYDALRLGLMLLCVGAANTLADARQALRSVPGALYEVSVAVVVAFSVAPQLIESTIRVHRARQLRGGVRKGIRGLPSLIIPVLADAVDRSLSLAQSMEVRGFGRTNRDVRHWGTTIGLIGGVMALMLGAFLLLGASDLRGVGGILLAIGFLVSIVTIKISGRRVGVTRYRPLPWGGPEWLTLAAGLATLAIALFMVWNFDRIMNPLVRPATFPVLDPMMIAMAAAAVLPAFATPQPPRASSVVTHD